ncbi:hypothetical protein JTB14_019575 [Gonioctena quinquepunctata]|nr:hypothetical protein JTB14_019575 [Gonioctena quinquepunctata]
MKSGSAGLASGRRVKFIMKSGSRGFIPEQTREVYNEVWLKGLFRSRRVKCKMKSGSTGVASEQTSEVYNEVWLTGLFPEQTSEV